MKETVFEPYYTTSISGLVYKRYSKEGMFDIKNEHHLDRVSYLFSVELSSVDFSSHDMRFTKSFRSATVDSFSACS